MTLTLEIKTMTESLLYCVKCDGNFAFTSRSKTKAIKFAAIKADKLGTCVNVFGIDNQGFWDGEQVRIHPVSIATPQYVSRSA